MIIQICKKEEEDLFRGCYVHNNNQRLKNLNYLSRGAKKPIYGTIALQ